MHLKAFCLRKKNSMTYAMYLYAFFKQDLIYICLFSFSLNHKCITKKTPKIRNRKINESSNLIRYEIKKELKLSKLFSVCFIQK